MKDEVFIFWSGTASYRLLVYRSTFVALFLLTIRDSRPLTDSQVCRWSSHWCLEHALIHNHHTSWFADRPWWGLLNGTLSFMINVPQPFRRHELLYSHSEWVCCLLSTNAMGWMERSRAQANDERRRSLVDDNIIRQYYLGLPWSS